MKLSVIIPCFNAADTIGALLEALASQQWSEPWEVIISNNNSTDDSMLIVERYKERLPQMRVVEASARQGRSYARNVGARAAKGETLAFCDADDVVAPGWVAAIGTALSEHDLVASRFDFEKLNQHWAQRNRKWVTQQDRLQKVRFSPGLFIAGGSGLGIRQSLHETVGGFNESLPVLEDVEYCIRAQLTGVKFHFVPAATVYVRHSEQLKNSFHQARQWASYNVLMYKRYRNPSVELPQPWKRYIYDWRCLLADVRHARQKEDWAKCVWVLGWQVGLLQGSIKFWAPPVPI
ncbi:MAG TPA: glycosyltransferase family A protein [Pyrinomonadaceae bacterium]|nr:glycosyltransferase family A protein [Pyrinomonadaceae bacterium]